MIVVAIRFSTDVADSSILCEDMFTFFRRCENFIPFLTLPDITTLALSENARQDSECLSSEVL
jgi:hypothetical protein